MKLLKFVILPSYLNLIGIPKSVWVLQIGLHDKTEAYYGIPKQLKIKAVNMLPVELRKVVNKMYMI